MNLEPQSGIPAEIMGIDIETEQMMSIPKVNDNAPTDKEQATESSVNDNIEGITRMYPRIKVLNTTGVPTSVNYLSIVTDGGDADRKSSKEDDDRSKEDDT